MWGMYTTEYYSAVKKEQNNTIYSNRDATTNIIPSEMSQKEKDKGFRRGSVVKNHLQCRSCRRRGFEPCVRGIPWGRIMVTHSSKKTKTNKIWYHLYVESKIWHKLSESEVAQLCLTLCNPVDCNPPGFSVHGILQARILE